MSVDDIDHDAVAARLRAGLIAALRKEGLDDEGVQDMLDFVDEQTKKFRGESNAGK